MGRVGADPEIRDGSKHNYATFPLATSESWVDTTTELGRAERVEWHSIAVFKPGLIDIVSQYVSKGNRVMVTGKLTYQRMKDDSGNEISKRASIVATEVIKLSTNSDS